MTKKFKHLDLSPHWQQYFSKYPQGYTIIENLIDWVSQVDDMVDNQNKLNETVETYGDRLDEFIEQFDGNLAQNVIATLSEWQDSGFLDVVIDSALNTKYHEMDERLTTQLAEFEYQVKSENELRQAIADGHISISLKKDIELTSPVNFDGISIRLDLNGFKISLSDDFTGDYIFSVGYGEYIDTHVGHNRLSKLFYNGYIDCNDKEVYVFKYYFSWDFKCRDLRIERCGLGLIGYYDDAKDLVTRGAECVLNNITIIASELVDTPNIGVDIYFGDAHLTDVFPHYFTYGIRNRGSGNKFVNCHPWGLPVNYPVNRRMAIGFIEEGYNNYYHNCLADTPDVLNSSLPPSRENGGIGYYVENSISCEFTNCEILLSAGTNSKTVIGWYLNKQAVTQDKHYGNAIYWSNCMIRGTSSGLLKPIHFTGGRTLSITDCNFNKDKIVRQYTELNTSSTIFKMPLERADGQDLSSTEVPENNSFKVLNTRGIMTTIFKDINGENHYYYLRPYVNNRYKELSALAELKTQLLAEKEANGTIDRTGTVTTLLAVWDNELGRDVYNMVYWNRHLENFYFMKDNTLVELP